MDNTGLHSLVTSVEDLAQYFSIPLKKEWQSDTENIIHLINFEDGKTSGMNYAASKGYNILLLYVLDLEHSGSPHPGSPSPPLETPLLDKRDIRGDTPLMSAVLAGNCSTAELLIRNGAEISRRNYYGETPLFVAIQRRYHTMVDIMAKYATDIEWGILDVQRRSVLFLAVENMYNCPKVHMCKTYEALRETCHDPNQVIKGMREAFSFANSISNDGMKILELVSQRYLSLPGNEAEYMACILLACTNGDMLSVDAMVRQKCLHDEQARY
jgi:hypothetical protein